ncbi:MAG: AAA family ATPase [Acetobacteraceae bacterium]
MMKKSDLRFTSLELGNWRNFGKCAMDLAPRVFLVGPNASGKSNLLDVFRFLHELVTPGGGLQRATEQRGGVSSLRALHARREPEVRIKVKIGSTDKPDQWSYELAFNARRNTPARIITEQVCHDGQLLLDRPDGSDRADARRLTQTHLEQISANQAFRPLADFLTGVSYLHVVPQLIRDPNRRGTDSTDPLGGDLIQRIAETPKRTRDARLERILKGLQVAVPQIETIALTQDTRGLWHILARYRHWRGHGALQDEERFSDGTLRLFALLWALLEPGGPLLLEEPELSLHPAVVVQLPRLFARMQRASGRQAIITTNAESLLREPGIGLHEVFLLRPAEEGTKVEPASTIKDIQGLLEGGLPLGEALMPNTAPERADELARLAL